MRKTSMLKNLILDEEILVMPGAYDALSARIIELVGFKAVMLGGYSATASRLGKPDVSLLGLKEMADCLHYIVEAVDLPVFADGDTGHGNVTNVQRTVREFEKAGVAALFIEDQVFPKRCGHMEGKQIIPAMDMVAKVKAAVDARLDQDLVIMARTDAVATDGLEEAIDRANKYREAGADLILVEALNSVEEMKRANDAIDAPTMANLLEGGKTPALTMKELQDLGFSIVVMPNAAVYTVAWALKNLWEGLKRDETTKAYWDKMILFDDFNKIVGLDKIRAAEAHYLQDIFQSLQPQHK